MNKLAANIPTLPNTPAPLVAAAAKKPPYISWEQFQRRYLKKEDKYKYEWVRGTVQKTLRDMNQSQLTIWRFLKNHLAHLQKNKNAGELVLEVDSFFAGAHRRPDLSYFSPEQILLWKNEDQVPAFVIEIISNNDQLNNAHQKMEDYRQAGVSIVWHIFPKLRQVHVYKGKHMTICTDDDPCSAEPVIPGFFPTANAVFAEPTA